MKSRLFILITLLALCTNTSVYALHTVYMDINNNRTVQPIKQLNQEEKEKVRALAAKMPDETKIRYAEFLEKWEKAIQTDGKAKLAASTSAYTQLKEFEALRNMGSEIIPLVMEGMMDGQKPYLFKLYYAISLDGCKGKGSTDCPELSEQDKATKAIRVWLSDNK